MSDTSRDTGKSMWDVAMEADGDAAPRRTARRDTPPPAPSVIDHQEQISDDNLGSSTASPAATSMGQGRKKRSGLVIAGLAVIAAGAAALLYLQGAPTAISGVRAVATEQAAIAPAAYTPKRVRFGDLLSSDSPLVGGKSLAELVMESATVSPVTALPAAEWRGAECSSCHNWTKARLCDQGKWYQTHGSAAIDRIGHPYGGDFKRALLNWTSQGCQ